MTRTTICLRPEVTRRLGLAAARRHRSEVELIREAVDRLLAEEPPLVMAELDCLIPPGSVLVPRSPLSTSSRRERTRSPQSAFRAGQGRSLMANYVDVDIGLTDAVNVVIAGREGTDSMPTLDERHFRAIRPTDDRFPAFRVLPADA